MATERPFGGYDEVDRMGHGEHASDHQPEPPWSDADFIEVARDEAEERGEFDFEIFDVPPFCMFDVGGRPCIYPAGHDGDHRPMPTRDDVTAARGPWAAVVTLEVRVPVEPIEGIPAPNLIADTASSLALLLNEGEAIEGASARVVDWRGEDDQ